MPRGRFFEDSVTSLEATAYATVNAIRQSIPGDTLIDVIRDPVSKAKLLNDNNLLKGVIMTRDGPVASSRQLIQEPSNLNVTVNTVGTINTSTVESEFSETLMRKNYNSASVKVSVPYITATAEYSRETKYKHSQTEKTVIVSSRYLFPQGRVDFAPPGSGFVDQVELTPIFLEAIQKALLQSDPAHKRVALHQVFEEYGHVFRTRVEIGGVLSGHTMEVIKETGTENEVKEDIKAGIEGAVKDWGGGVTAGHGNTESTVVTKKGRSLNVKYIVNGGDYTKIQDVKGWIASTNQSEYWRDIEVSAVVSTVDMLPEGIRETVRDLMKPLLGKWVDVKRIPDPEKLSKEIYRPKDNIPLGWYWVGYTADSEKALIVKPTLPPGQNPAITTGHRESVFASQPFPNIPQYAFLSTYFEYFQDDTPPGCSLAAFRPDLFEEGRHIHSGESIATSVFVTRPMQASDPTEEVFDLQPAIRVKLFGSDIPPRPRWLLKESVVLLEP